MSKAIRIEDDQFGPKVAYEVTANTALRLYDVEPQNERIPDVGESSATLKGGYRVNLIGVVPLLDGAKEYIGMAKITNIVIAHVTNLPLEEIRACGLNDRSAAVERARLDEEFEQSGGVVSVVHYRVESLDNL